MTKKQIIRAIIILPIIIMVSWYFFNYIYTYPKVELWRNGNRLDATLIKIEDGYQFMENPYTIENTEDGYDIIVHLMLKEELIK